MVKVYTGSLQDGAGFLSKECGQRRWRD